MGQRIMFVRPEMFVGMATEGKVGRKETLTVGKGALPKGVRILNIGLTQQSVDSWALEYLLESEAWEPSVDRFGRPEVIEPTFNVQYDDI